MLDRLAKAGCGPVLAVDLTRPAQPVAGVSVLRVIVPGLEAEGGLPGTRAARPEAHFQ